MSFVTEIIWSVLPSDTCVQCVYKWMGQFQKLRRNLFLTLHGQNVHRQQRQLSKFLMRYQQFAFHAYCGASLQDGPAVSMSERTAGSAWETWTVAAADGVRFARVRWEINFFLTFETAPFICKHPV